MEHLFLQRNSEFFPVSIGASRNFSKGPEETLLDAVENVSFFFLHLFARVSVKLQVNFNYYFLMIERSTGHVQVKYIYNVRVCGLKKCNRFLFMSCPSLSCDHNFFFLF